MATVRIQRSVEVNVSADRVWELVGDFSAIGRWHPTTPHPVIRGPGAPHAPGTERVFGVGTTEEMTERLVERDATARRLRYTMPDPPFAITNHQATLEVDERGAQRSAVTWTATFDASEHTAELLEEQMGDAVFSTGLNALVERYRQSRAPADTRSLTRPL